MVIYTKIPPLKAKIKELEKKHKIPRGVALLVLKLNMSLQPNFGSSLYWVPKKRKPWQDDWDCPHGTLRLSDHWNYENANGQTVYKINVPNLTWALAINTQYGWESLYVFDSIRNNNQIRGLKKIFSDYTGLRREHANVLAIDCASIRKKINSCLS